MNADGATNDYLFKEVEQTYWQSINQQMWIKSYIPDTLFITTKKRAV